MCGVRSQLLTYPHNLHGVGFCAFSQLARPTRTRRRRVSRRAPTAAPARRPAARPDRRRHLRAPVRDPNPAPANSRPPALLIAVHPSDRTTACAINTFTAGAGVSCATCAAGSDTQGLTGASSCTRKGLAAVAVASGSHMAHAVPLPVPSGAARPACPQSALPESLRLAAAHALVRPVEHLRHPSARPAQSAGNRIGLETALTLSFTLFDRSHVHSVRCWLLQCGGCNLVLDVPGRINERQRLLDVHLQQRLRVLRIRLDPDLHPYAGAGRRHIHRTTAMQLLTSGQPHSHGACGGESLHAECTAGTYASGSSCVSTSRSGQSPYPRMHRCRAANPSVFPANDRLPAQLLQRCQRGELHGMPVPEHKC